MARRPLFPACRQFFGAETIFSPRRLTWCHCVPSVGLLGIRRLVGGEPPPSLLLCNCAHGLSRRAVVRKKHRVGFPARARKPQILRSISSAVGPGQEGGTQRCWRLWAHRWVGGTFCLLNLCSFGERKKSPLWLEPVHFKTWVVAGVTAKNLQGGRATRPPGAAGVSSSGGASCPSKVVGSAGHPPSAQAAVSVPGLGAR